MNTTRRHRFRLTALLAVTLVAFATAGCESDSGEKPSDESASATEADRASDEAENDEKADKADEPEHEKIVTLGGTVTEVVYALGAGDRVVAVDKTSVYPPETEEKRKLDLFSKTSAESVLSYDPDLVIATDATEPPEALEKIEAADVRVETVESSESIEAAYKRITAIGKVLGLQEEAKTLNETLEEDVAEATKLAEQCEAAPKTLFVYARGKGTVFVSGGDTSAAKMIEKAGGEHVPDGIEGFKPLTPESVVDVSPDAIVLTTRGLQSLGGIDGLSKLPGIGESRAVKNERVIAIDDLELLGFGPRSGEALQTLSRKLCETEESK